jgi:hypothetical protein
MKKLIFVFVLFFISTSFVFAEGYSLEKAVTDVTQAKEFATPNYLPIPSEDAKTPEMMLSNTIQRVTNYISALAAGIAILFIVINAGKLVLSLGGSDEITSAKKGLTWALGGLGVIMFAFVIAKTVISIVFTGEPSE